jgi:hypothetical protein
MSKRPAASNLLLVDMHGRRIEGEHEVDRMAAQGGDDEAREAELHFAALKRILDREEPDYAS